MRLKSLAWMIQYKSTIHWGKLWIKKPQHDIIHSVTSALSHFEIITFAFKLICSSPSWIFTKGPIKVNTGHYTSLIMWFGRHFYSSRPEKTELSYLHFKFKILRVILCFSRCYLQTCILCYWIGRWHNLKVGDCI